MKIKISLISVNYKVEKELIACISSIVESKPKVSYEIIIVDNEEKDTISKILKEKFPKVKYIKSPGNIGYGAGNNLGAKSARGEFLFFLNPDTVVANNSIDILYNFLVNNFKAGMIAPLLCNPKGFIYPSQGSDGYDLLSALVVNSSINKYFPNNPISKKFFHKDWNKKNNEELDVVPGTAFMIRKSIFEKVGMFDEKFFLYFEEYDLAKRIKNLGYRNYIISKSKISHIWEASTKKRKDIDKIFSQSRYLFFKKHYGLFTALIVKFVSNFGKYELMLGLILSLTAFLGLFKIVELMSFIGDQAWFYLSARDMVLKGEIPLVGIASSRPWLHQGPLWTYLLAPFLWISNFNPVSGAYLTMILGILSTLGVYIAGSRFFAKRVGIIASLLYATSPLVVFNMRMPYHTSPIPLFVIALIFSLYKIAQNKLSYLPLTLFLLAILYNFEIATVVLWGVVIIVLGYKLLKNEISFKEMINKKLLILSGIGLAIPLLPIILYDVRNGFPQTIKFIAWIFYRAISFFGFNSQHEFSANKIILMLNFLFDNFKKLIFVYSDFISLVIFIAVAFWAIHSFFQKKVKGNMYNLIHFLFFVPLLLIILNQTPSDAYLPILFPTSILIISLFFDHLMRIKKMFLSTLSIILIIVFSNIYYMLDNNFAFDHSSKKFILEKKLQMSKEILNRAKDNEYNLIGKGLGSEHKSFTMSYEYLTFWLGHPPAKPSKNLKFIIQENENGISLFEK